MTTTAAFLMDKRHLDVVFAASRICYVLGSAMCALFAAEFARRLSRLSKGESDFLFVPVVHGLQTVERTQPMIWMKETDGPVGTQTSKDLCEIQSSPVAQTCILACVTPSATPQSLADAARSCELLRGWVLPRAEDTADVGWFCDLHESTATPGFLEQLRKFTATATFVVISDKEMANRVGLPANQSAKTKIFFCPPEAVDGFIWALAAAVSAGGLQRRYRRSISQLAATMEQLADLQFDYEKLLDAADKLPVGGQQVSKATAYREMIRRTHLLVRQTIPPKSTVLVVSKGDPDLVNLDNRRGLHYPQIEGGVWAGHHPRNSAAAITQLEALRAQGADYFLLPSIYKWWLDYYRKFAQHLSTHYRLAADDPNVALIFDLGSGKTKAAKKIPRVKPAKTLSASERRRSRTRRHAGRARKRSRKIRANKRRS